MDFKELKNEYEKYSKKYKLPDFNLLNEDFEVGKLEKDCGTFLRAIRKIMMEKVVNSLGFLEMLLNPLSVPRIYFVYVKNMMSSDKDKIEKIYFALSEISLDALECEIKYNEKEEAELIKKIFKVWNEIKEDFLKVINNIKKPNNNFVKKDKSYFG